MSYPEGRYSTVHAQPVRHYQHQYYPRYTSPLLAAPLRQFACESYDPRLVCEHFDTIEQANEFREVVKAVERRRRIADAPVSRDDAVQFLDSIIKQVTSLREKKAGNVMRCHVLIEKCPTTVVPAAQRARTTDRI